MIFFDRKKDEANVLIAKKYLRINLGSQICSEKESGLYWKFSEDSSKKFGWPLQGPSRSDFSCKNVKRPQLSINKKTLRVAGTPCYSLNLIKNLLFALWITRFKFKNLKHITGIDMYFRRWDPLCLAFFIYLTIYLTWRFKESNSYLRKNFSFKRIYHI